MTTKTNGRFISVATFKWLHKLTPDQLTVISRFTADLAKFKVGDSDIRKAN